MARLTDDADYDAGETSGEASVDSLIRLCHLDPSLVWTSLVEHGEPPSGHSNPPEGLYSFQVCPAIR
ncbi:unnamed protein product [Protopolystoma xenopodis]|uniref:Uncharacterized protein n=1 Tax=Protopolystoma xenopodis TaxID=117903 RepID=A0A448WGC0_9PLAT|nr:unnamed protein product [Protopolystoma xenopodis]